MKFQQKYHYVILEKRDVTQFFSEIKIAIALRYIELVVMMVVPIRSERSKSMNLIVLSTTFHKYSPYHPRISF